MRMAEFRVKQKHHGPAQIRKIAVNPSCCVLELWGDDVNLEVYNQVYDIDCTYKESVDELNAALCGSRPKLHWRRR
jgi:hypothetical protein